MKRHKTIRSHLFILGSQYTVPTEKFAYDRTKFSVEQSQTTTPIPVVFSCSQLNQKALYPEQMVLKKH